MSSYSPIRARAFVLACLLALLAVSMAGAAFSLRAPLVISTQSVASVESSPAPDAAPTSHGSLGAEAAHAMAGQIPFEPNLGQAPPRTRFLAHLGLVAVELLEDGVRTTSPYGDVAGFRFAGARTAPVLGESPLSSYTSYFLAERKLPAVPHYGAVRYEGLYPGIDVVFYTAADGALEFDYVVSPGADPSVIRLEPTGASRLAAGPDGALHVAPGFHLEAPIAFQGATKVPVRYVVHPDGAATLALGGYDAARPLVIDPKLGFSSFFGGSGSESFTAVDAYGGHLYVAGVSTSNATTRCSPRPSCPGPLSGINSGTVVAKFDLTVDGPTSLVWVARIQGVTAIYDIDVDQTGIYLTGVADPTLPVTGNAFQVRNGGAGMIASCMSPNDAFLAVLDLAASSLLYASYLGGQYDDQGYGVASEGNGRAVVVGAAQWTNGVPFPAKNGFQMVHNGPQSSYFCIQGTLRGCLDAFVARFDTTVPATPAGINPDSLLFASFLGGGGNAPPDCTTPNGGYPQGSGNDVATDVALQMTGSTLQGIWVSGYTTMGPASAPAFPAASGPGSVPPFQANPQGGGDAFLLKVSPTGDQVQYSSFLGGAQMDRAYGLALGNGRIYVTGVTTGSPSGFNLPLPPEGYRTAPYLGDAALQDAFVAGFDPATGQMDRGTLLGSVGEQDGVTPIGCLPWTCQPVLIGNDAGVTVQVSENGDVHVQGITDKGSRGTGGQFPSKHAWPGLAGHRLDLFAARFDADLTTLRSSTAIGSAMNDVDRGAANRPGWPPGNGYPSPGHFGALLTDADGTSSAVVVGGTAWGTRADLTTTWNSGDGRGDRAACVCQQYLVNRWQIQTAACPSPPSPWADPCYQWPANGHLQWNVTLTSVDVYGNVNTFTKPMHLVRCGAAYYNGGLPIPQSATPNPEPAQWPKPFLRGNPISGHFWSNYDQNCINPTPGFWNPFTFCCDFWQDNFPTAGGFPVEHSASNLLIPLPPVKSFSRNHSGFGFATSCCTHPEQPNDVANAPKPEGVIARLVDSPPFVVCGVTSTAPHHRGTPVAFTWAPTGLPRTQGVETYDPAVPDPDYGMDISSFRWDFDYDGTFDPWPAADGQVTPSVSYPFSTLPGAHTVMVQARDTDGRLGTGTCTIELTNRAPVVACAAVGGPHYANSDVAFSSAGTLDPDGTIALYSWSFPGATTASSGAANPATKWLEPGTYAVTLQVTDNNGATSPVVSCPVTVLPGAVCNPGTVTALTGEPVVLEASGGGDPIYTWSAPGGTPSSGTGTEFTVSFADPGTHFVQVTADGEQFATCKVQTLTPSKMSCAAPGSIPVGQDVTLSATGGRPPYTWTVFGEEGAEPSSGTGSLFTTRFAYGGTYTVRVEGGSFRADCELRVVQPCAAHAQFATSSREALPGRAITFRDESLGELVAWLWDFGDGEQATSPTATHAYTLPGRYVVRLTVTERGSGCQSSMERTLTVAHPVAAAESAESAALGSATVPVADAGPDLTVVEGALVDLSGSANDPDPASLDYRWTLVEGPPGIPESSGDRRLLFAAPSLPLPEQEITFTYELRVARGAAVSLPDLVRITVKAGNLRPVADAGPDQEVRKGGTVHLDGSSSRDPEGLPLTYSWRQVGGVPVLLDGTSGATPSFAVSRNGAGSFAEFELTVSDGRWSAIDTVRVDLVPDPRPTRILADRTGPATFRFAPDVAVEGATWSFGDGASSSDAEPTHTYTGAGTYTVRLTLPGGEGEALEITRQVSVSETYPVTNAQQAKAGFPWHWALGLLGLGILLALLLVRRERRRS